MKTPLIALTCALLATACANSDNHSAQHPSSAGAAEGAHYQSFENNGSAGRASTMASETPVQTRVDASVADAAYSQSTLDAGPLTRGPLVASNSDAVGQTNSADNTKTNDRERSGLTPMNQGNSAQETDITAAIRRAVMSDKTLSFTANNVKIITVDDKVTLRGAAKNEREKNVIESLARNTAGVAEVDDQIEVKR